MGTECICYYSLLVLQFKLSFPDGITLHAVISVMKILNNEKYKAYWQATLLMVTPFYAIYYHYDRINF